jgi:NADH dehydrogenase
MDKKKIIVVGGGFAGLQFIRHLDEELFEVLLIDKQNHHQFQPLFYQVATSQIEPSSISFPLRKIFHHRKIMQIRLAEVLRVNSPANTLETSIGSFRFDLLVVAIGGKTNFFGNKKIEEYAYALKTTYDAIEIRNNILLNFEKILSAGEEEREYLMNIVIVGAGPTGVELCGSFAEIKSNILPKDYPHIDFRDLKIILLEGSSATLNGMSDLAKRSSEKYLRDMGVEIRTNVFVTDYDGKTVLLNNGDTIKSRSVIWTAGITGNTIDGLKTEVVLPNGRIKTDRYNQVEGYGNIYAIGDIAYMETPLYPKGHPQVANVAIHQARKLARNLKATMKGRKLKPYEYVNFGSMATIGTNKAVVDLPFIQFKGYFAWFVWMFLHLMLILSVRNKLVIFINWAWGYLTKDSSLRLILKNNIRGYNLKPDSE